MAQPIKVVIAIAMRIAFAVTQPCAHARLGPRRVSSSVPFMKSK